MSDKTCVIVSQAMHAIYLQFNWHFAEHQLTQYVSYFIFSCISCWFYMQNKHTTRTWFKCEILAVWNKIFVIIIKKKIPKICASKWLNLPRYSFFQFISWPVGREFRKYLNLTTPARFYPKQCPTLPHVSPKFLRSVRLCPIRTSSNFLLFDWLTTNGLMINDLYLETRKSTLSVDVWNVPVRFGESFEIMWRMLW